MDEERLDLGSDDEGFDEAEAFFSEEGSPDAPSADLLRVMKEFVTDHCKSLSEVREALSGTVSEAWAQENELITLNTEPHDTQHILHMVHTDNHQLNKVIIAFAVLVEEINELNAIASDKFYGSLAMFGVAAPEGEKQDSVEGQIGAFLPFLSDLLNFVNRIHSVAKNLVNQLACLYNERQKLWLSTFKLVHLPSVFEALGVLCRILITMDAIIADNTAIKYGWTAYKRMIKYVRADPDRYGIEAPRLRQFEALLVRVDKQVVARKLFEGLLTADFGLPGSQNSKTLIGGNKALCDEFMAMIKELLKRTTASLGKQAVETYGRESVVEVYGLYALYRALFCNSKKIDKSFFKKLWSVQRVIPVVPLYSRACWNIPDFLSRFADSNNMQGLSPPPQAVKKARMEFLTSMDDDFQKVTEDLYMHMCMWMVRIESELVANKSNSLTSVLSARSKLILNGVLLANQIRTHITTSIHLHLMVEAPFKAQNVRSMAICSEMLKAIEQTYQRRVSMIGENMSQMITQTSLTLKRVFEPIKKKLDKRSRLDDAKLDVLSAVGLSIDLLSRHPSAARRCVLGVSLAIAQVKGMLRQNHTDEVRFQVWKLNLLSQWQRKIEDTCTCDFLYMVSNLVPAFFKDIFNHPEQVNRLNYLFAAFKDSTRLLSKSLTYPVKFVNAYKEEVLGHFTENVVDPLARAVETDLRLHIHSVVLEQKSLHKESSKDLAKFLNLTPKPFFDIVIDIKHRVTHYLNATFYNLLALTLSDWKVYAEMRNLAQEKFGIAMTEVHLPGSSHYSDALDILEIMRKIHVFVAHYKYNMNDQIFVERAFDQKHLNTINIYHIAQAIRTHGTGIMNTTVNFTYQFLVHKFELFSEFLFDDYIKSWLLKDIRYFRTEKFNINSMYPYSRAEKFNKDIRKLGTTEDGQTFLCQFRNQITEIGNALGYVRMVRSGGLHHLANAISFVPDLDTIPSFNEGIPETCSEDTKTAASNLDQVLDDLSTSFAEGTEYYQILVSIFAPVFNTPNNGHLKNFFAIVPPLMLNFVEKQLVEKDKLNKRGSKQEASFTDDGFPLGLAYILKVLDQDQAFDSLHWFDSVNVHLKKKKKKLMDQKKGGEEEISFQPSVKRIDTFQREFDLLLYSFNGARVFFNDHDAQMAKEKEEEEAAAAAAASEGAAAEAEPGAPADGSAPAPPPPAPGASPPPAPGAPPPPPPPPPML